VARSSKLGGAVLQQISVEAHLTLEDYGAYAHLQPPLQELRAEARVLVPELAGRRILMVSSTAQGGGVAEMMPKVVSLLREVGVPTEWLVMGSERPEFFVLTKRLHNLIHGVGDPRLGAEEKSLYEEVSRENAALLAAHVRPQDLLVIHDPQPMGCGALVRRELGTSSVWRCHIGLDQENDATRAAWEFLRPWAEPYDHAVFSAPEYIAPYLAGRATVSYPTIDPLSHKNRELSVHKLQGVLCNSGLAVEHAPVLTPAFDHQARRLSPSGEWVSAITDPMGLMFRTLVVQISRWDRLKGFAPLLDAFVLLKTRHLERAEGLHRRRLEIVRLVLAGPDPASVADDPEGVEVIEELSGRYLALPTHLQRDVALLSLPMASRKENALMVNALQRCASLVAQNSLEEGFGLTVTEAMWKQRPVLGTRACGIRHQVREGIDGHLVADPEDPEELAAALDALLADPAQRHHMGNSGQRRVHSQFLVFSQILDWLRMLSELTGLER
jgi:trehalose synthase